LLSPCPQQTADGPLCAETVCRQWHLQQNRKLLLFTDQRRDSVELQKTQICI